MSVHNLEEADLNANRRQDRDSQNSLRTWLENGLPSVAALFKRHYPNQLDEIASKEPLCFDENFDRII